MGKMEDIGGIPKISSFDQAQNLEARHGNTLEPIDDVESVSSEQAQRAQDEMKAKTKERIARYAADLAKLDNDIVNLEAKIAAQEDGPVKKAFQKVLETFKNDREKLMTEFTGVPESGTDTAQ